MSIDTKHPHYDLYCQTWKLMRDAYAGERAVKQEGILYLPPTAGMILDGMKAVTDVGSQAYNAYRMRAAFPDYVSEGVELMIGMMHRQPADITLPAALEGMRDRATVNGEGLQQLLRRINECQLVTGRLGLLLDLPSTETLGDVLPHIAIYEEKDIRNWDQNLGTSLETALNLVVLDESGPVRQADLTWKEVRRYRVLVLGSPDGAEPEGAGFMYRYTVVEDTALGGGLPPEDQFSQPTLRGNTLEQIPFVFINSKDNLPEPDDPPLLDLANLCMTIYRADADYRQNLHMQGQDTLVIKSDVAQNDSGTHTWRTGTGATIEVGAGGDAKYIGVQSTGLPEQGKALALDHQRASHRAGQLINTQSGQKESGDALQTRVAAQTASLVQIARTGAAGLQQILRIAAIWKGANPDEVVVKPNVDFGEIKLTGLDMVQMITARRQGFPLSQESMHAILVDKGLTKFTYEQELELIANEDAAFLNTPPANAPQRGLPGGGGQQG
jgi:hypothetical protein